MSDFYEAHTEVIYVFGIGKSLDLGQGGHRWPSKSVTFKVEDAADATWFESKRVAGEPIRLRWRHWWMSALVCEVSSNGEVTLASRSSVIEERLRKGRP